MQHRDNMTALFLEEHVYFTEQRNEMTLAIRYNLEKKQF